MNSKYMVIVAAMAVMLIGATALATDDAFAGKKKYGKNQVISQANACGNGKLPMYVFCQNTGSQVQGENNGVSLSGAQESEESTLFFVLDYTISYTHPSVSSQHRSDYFLYHKYMQYSGTLKNLTAY